MNFLAPFAFAFAATIPVVILFYLLKRKRVVRLVSSTLLWQKFLAETQASAPFQKLRHNWLLLLQLLLLILAILALTRPYFAGKTQGGRLEVVILDASASMQSRDVSPSRFEKAQSEALKLVDAMHDRDQMVVLQAGAMTEVKQSATSEKSALRRAIGASRATDTSTRLQEALKLAETLTRDRADAQIHLFSDGAFGALAEFETSGLPLVFHRMGANSENLGITTLDVRPHPENPSHRAVFASVANYSTNSQQAQLEFLFEGELLEVQPLRLEPGQNAPHVFSATQDKDGVFSVRLNVDDHLAADNQASIFSPLPQPIKILLVSAGNRFLERAIRSSVLADLSVASVLNDPAPDFDLVVLDNVLPLVWPAPNTLAFHVATTNLFPGWSVQANPPIVDWKGNHPLLRFVHFDNVSIAETLAVQTPPWAVAVVESPQTPLVLAGETGRQRLVWVGFDIVQSNWPLRVSFPIFMANALEWLNPLAINSGQLMVSAGQPFRFLLKEAVTTAQIQLPDGSSVPWRVNPANGEVLFGDTLKQGVYRLNADTNHIVFCVNLLDAAESNTAPKEELLLGKYAKVESTVLRKANLEIWRWFAAIALAVLMFEWWYYHRRTV